MTHDLPTFEILGVPVAAATRAEALGEIERLADRGAALVAYANAHTLNTATADPGYREVLTSADLILNDGVGLAMAARLLGGRFPENLNGSDLNPEILRLAARREWPVFFLGAAAGVAEGAAAKLSGSIEGLRVAGTRDGYFLPEQAAEVAAGVAATGAAVVMVAMGNPAQERWLADHLTATGCRLGVGVGAFFDFSAGRVRRAPAWMNKVGLEWVFRLALEPGRMWRRYVVGNPLFLWRVLRARWSRRGGSSRA